MSKNRQLSEIQFKIRQTQTTINQNLIGLITEKRLTKRELLQILRRLIDRFYQLCLTFRNAKKMEELLATKVQPQKTNSLQLYANRDSLKLMTLLMRTRLDQM